MDYLKGKNMRCSGQNHAADTIDIGPGEENTRHEKIDMVRAELIQIATRYMKELTTPEIAEVACICARHSSIYKSRVAAEPV